MLTSVFPDARVPMQCVVQKICQAACDKCFWLEWNIDYIIELSRHKKDSVNLSRARNHDMNFELEACLRLKRDKFGTYPSSAGVNRTITSDCSVFIKVLWHRQTQEDREAKNELCSEAVEIAELKEAKTASTCIYMINTVPHSLRLVKRDQNSTCVIVKPCWISDTYQHKQRKGNIEQQRWVLGLKQRLLRTSLFINEMNK